jgi:hypothetical protein
MEIKIAVIEDIDEIFRQYKVATDLQIEEKMVHWPVSNKTWLKGRLPKKDFGRC